MRGCLGFIMGKDKELDRGIIPAGTRVKLFEGRVTLLEDVAVDADQEWIDKAIKDQEDYFNGIGVVGENPTSKLEAGTLSAMHVSASVGTQTNSSRKNVYSKEILDNQLNISMQNAIKDAAKALNFANNARFINIVEWRTNMIDRLLSHVSIKTIDEAISECQKIEKHIFGEKEPEAPKDWRL